MSEKVEAYYISWTYPAGRARAYATASYRCEDGTWARLRKIYGENIPKAVLLKEVLEHFMCATVSGEVVRKLLKQPGENYLRITPKELRKRLSEIGIRVILQTR